MSVLLKIISTVSFVICLASAVLAIGLYWHFNFGACKDGCAGGMVYIYFLPAIAVSIVSAIIAFATRILYKRKSA